MTGSPPKRLTSSKFASEAVPIARTPRGASCWRRLTPTAPDAPWMTTVVPSFAGTMRSMSAAVPPTSSRFAASGKSSVAGLAKTSAAGTVSAELQPPETRKARTSSPTSPPPEAISVSGPIALSTPATSRPTGSGKASGSAPRAPLKSLKSTGLSPAARTSIVTSPAPGSGTSTSRTSSTSGPPYLGATTARAIVIPET